MLYYLSILIITSTIAGLLIAFIASIIIRRLDKIIHIQTVTKNEEIIIDDKKEITEQINIISNKELDIIMRIKK